MGTLTITRGQKEGKGGSVVAQTTPRSLSIFWHFPPHSKNRTLRNGRRRGRVDVVLVQSPICAAHGEPAPILVSRLVQCRGGCRRASVVV